MAFTTHQINERVRNPGIYARQPSFQQNPRIGVARFTDINYADVYNPENYWENMAPKDLYNINYVNTPNPIFQLLRKSPIHLSSIHQSFSS